MRGHAGTTVYLTKICPTCQQEFKTPDTQSRRGRRWCSKKCCESHPDKKRAGSSGLKKAYDLNSLLDIKFGKTCRRILKELNVGCSRCGWKEGTCDLHHINGKKVPNANHHWNLTLLCPNCHRLFHEKKITEKDVFTLEQQIGDSWKALYYG
jgi:hypothetical protein